MKYNVKPAEKRFWKKVDVRGADDCWNWLGGLGERHVEKPTDIFKSIDINVERFKIEPQLAQILKNTASYLWYE